MTEQEFLQIVREEQGDYQRVASRTGHAPKGVVSRISKARKRGDLDGVPRKRRIYKRRDQILLAAEQAGVSFNAAELAINAARRDGIIIHPYAAERRVLEQAAEQAGQTLTVFVLAAALSVARQQQAQTYTPHQLAHLQRKREVEGGGWALPELQARGLPLYWDTTWLRSQLDAGETYTSLAARHGWNARTVSNHGKRLGISLRRVLRLAEAGPWPATVAEVAGRQFERDSAAAAQWLSEQVANGYLRRTQRGVYDLAAQG